MKTILLAALAFVALQPLAVAQSQSLDKAARAARPGMANPEIPVFSTLSRALVDKHNSIVVSAWGGGLEFEGSTADSFETTLAITNPTAARTQTLPDGSGVVGLQATATLAAGATPSFAPASSVSAYLLTPAQDETIAGVTTGAIAGRSYFIRVLTSGTSSFTLTFGANFKSTGTLATGTVTAKVFIVQFLFDGTNFNEVSRTAAM